MDAEDLAEYKRRLRLREQRKASIRWAAGFSSYPGKGVPHPRARRKQNHQESEMSYGNFQQ